MTVAPQEPPQAPVRSIVAPGARASLALLLFINLFNYIDRYVLAAVEPLIAKDLLKPDDPNAGAKMGFLGTVFLVSYMLTAPIFGWLGDRFNRWVIIGIGVILWSLASGASGISHEAGIHLTAAGAGWLTGYTVLVLTRCLVGVGEGAYGPVAPSVIADMFPEHRRGAVMSWFYLAIPVGSALGFVLGGAIGTRFGWQWAFYAVVPPGLLLGMLSFFRREPRAAIAKSASKHRINWSSYVALLRNRSYVFDVLGMTAMTFAIGGVSFWMPRYVAQRLLGQSHPGADMQAPEMQAAMKSALDQANFVFGAIVVVTGIFATLGGGWLGDKLKPRFPGSYFLVSSAAMLIGFPLFLAVLVTPFPYCWVVIALAVFCLFFNTGPSNTIIANVTHPSIRSSAFALCILTIHALGDAISPPIIGMVSDRAGGNLNAGFQLVSVAILIAAIFWFLGARHLAKDTAAAQHPPT